MFYTQTTLQDSPELYDNLISVFKDSKPEFMQNSNTMSWDTYYKKYKSHVHLFVKDGEIMGVGFVAPINWDLTIVSLPHSMEEILILSEATSETANTLVITEFLVAKDYQKQGLSGEIMKGLVAQAKALNLSRIISPVRPLCKTNYPLQSLESYTSWRRADGTYVDPCLRIFQKANGRIIKLVSSIIFVNLTLTKWEECTGMIFPESGKYIVEGALQPVMIDKKSNNGFYMDPSVWMECPLD